MSSRLGVALAEEREVTWLTHAATCCSENKVAKHERQIKFCVCVCVCVEINGSNGGRNIMTISVAWLVIGVGTRTGL